MCVEVDNFLEKNYSNFQFINTQENKFFLKSLKPYMCITCNRIHEHENPYLFVLQNKLYFNCRRSTNNKSTILCDIGIEENKIIDNSNISEVLEIYLGDTFITKINTEKSEIHEKVEVEEIKTTSPKITDNISESQIELPKYSEGSHKLLLDFISKNDCSKKVQTKFKKTTKNILKHNKIPW